MEQFEIITFITLGISGLGATAFYYFFRFYFYKENQELKETSEDKTLAKNESKKATLATEKNTDSSFKQGAKKTLTLNEALLKSKKSFWSKQGSSNEEEVKSLDELEESLYMADIGPQTVQYLLDKVRAQSEGESFDLGSIKKLFKKEMLSFFDEDEGSNVFKRMLEKSSETSGPYVVSVVGVNGAGKTTTIGKLANKLSKEGLKVMVAAGDTFRAAAENQLNVWAKRSDALIFKAPKETKDPSAVAFQAYEKAKKEDVDVLLIDTAGRLHTQDNLMKELEKVGRVLKKHDENAPHECFMILDSNTGMNAAFQAENFHKTLSLTALILTKLDGSAKAGMTLGVRRSLGVPVMMVGLGEGIEDLRLFEPSAFVESLV